MFWVGEAVSEGDPASLELRLEADGNCGEIKSEFIAYPGCSGARFSSGLLLSSDRSSCAVHAVRLLRKNGIKSGVLLILLPREDFRLLVWWVSDLGTGEREVTLLSSVWPVCHWRKSGGQHRMIMTCSSFLLLDLCLSDDDLDS